MRRNLKVYRGRTKIKNLKGRRNVKPDPYKWVKNISTILIIIAIAIILSMMGCNASFEKTAVMSYGEVSNEKKAWWFVRNDEHEVSGCDSEIDLAKYDAYYCFPSKENDDKVIYFTFDCGYENGNAEKILDILARNDAKACFFVTKSYIKDNVDIVKRMKEEGHLVGNHTISHPSMPDKSIEEQTNEIEGCADYMKEATGYEMDHFFRPPRGEYSERTLQLAKNLGYKTVFWSIAFLDYDTDKQPGCEYVITHFRKYHHDGAIVLLHIVSTSDTEALETVLHNLKEEGYRFGSLEELTVPDTQVPDTTVPGAGIIN